MPMFDNDKAGSSPPHSLTAVPAWIVDPYYDRLMVDVDRPKSEEIESTQSFATQTPFVSKSLSTTTPTNKYLNNASPVATTANSKSSGFAIANIVETMTRSSSMRTNANDFHRKAAEESRVIDEMEHGAIDRSSLDERRDNGRDENIERAHSAASVADEIKAAVVFRLQEEALFGNWISLTPSEVWRSHSQRASPSQKSMPRSQGHYYGPKEVLGKSPDNASNRQQPLPLPSERELSKIYSLPQQSKPDFSEAIPFHLPLNKQSQFEVPTQKHHIEGKELKKLNKNPKDTGSILDTDTSSLKKQASIQLASAQHQGGVTRDLGPRTVAHRLSQESDKWTLTLEDGEPEAHPIVPPVHRTGNNASKAIIASTGGEETGPLSEFPSWADESSSSSSEPKKKYDMSQITSDGNVKQISGLIGREGLQSNTAISTAIYGMGTGRVRSRDKEGFRTLPTSPLIPKQPRREEESSKEKSRSHADDSTESPYSEPTSPTKKPQPPNSPSSPINRRRKVTFGETAETKTSGLVEDVMIGVEDEEGVPAARRGNGLSVAQQTEMVDVSMTSVLSDSWHDEMDAGSTASQNELDGTMSSHRRRGSMQSTESATSRRSDVLGRMSFHNRRGSMQSAGSGTSRKSEVGASSSKRKRGVLRTTGKLAKRVVMQPGILAKNVVKLGMGGKGKEQLLPGDKSLQRGALDGPIDLDTGHLEFEEYDLIEKTLKKNLMFRELFDGALHALILSFEKIEVEKGRILIQQGQATDDSVYVVAEGESSVLVDGIEVAGPFGTLGPMSIFGQLGVVFNHNHASETIAVKTKKAVLFKAPSTALSSAINIMPEDDNCNELGKDEVDMKAIDRAINQLSGTKSLYGGEITRQYQPNRLWLWSQWHGTILEQNLFSTIMCMLFSLLLVVVIQLFAEPTWAVGEVPDPDHPLIQNLSQYYGVWSFSVTLNTFVLTFYVNQAYLFWQSTNELVRGIQGGISDFMISLATHAKRGEDGIFTRDAEAVMDDVGSSARLFHALFWANCARRFYCLATPTGMATMAQRGMMTPKQLKILQSLKTPYGTKHNACLEWMMVRACDGMESGHFRNTDALSRHLLETTCRLRSTSVKVTDSLKSRMPLAYTHLVQILVDGFIIASPLALYPQLGVYSILSVGVITLFYGGLLDMAKTFLDPLDNQHFKKTSLNMGLDLGVLTKESNASTSHFKENARKVPF